jgi:hypothetical protein
MRRLMLVLAVAALLLVGLVPSASAAPAFGSRWTARHGWIVWADNDRAYPIRTRCSWFAGGSRWTTNWRLAAYVGYSWTTSDAGNWGNRRPRNLHCSYRRTY